MTTTETIAAFLAAQAPIGSAYLPRTGLPNPLTRIQAQEAAQGFCEIDSAPLTAEPRYRLVPGTELCDVACLACDGEGSTPPAGVNGWALRCDVCHGTGKDMRGCEFCFITHDPQHCPAIRARLFR